MQKCITNVRLRNSCLSSQELVGHLENLEIDLKSMFGKQSFTERASGHRWNFFRQEHCYLGVEMHQEYSSLKKICGVTNIKLWHFYSKPRYIELIHCSQ